MNHKFLSVSLASLLALAPLTHAEEAAPSAAPAPAQPAAATLKTLALGRVKATPSVLAAATGEGRKNSIDRMSQALDGQLIASVQQTRKFTVLARSDSDALIEENAAAGQTFDFGKSDLTLVVTIDDFQDFTQTATFAAIGKTATIRVIRFSYFC